MSDDAPLKRLYMKTYGCQMKVYDSERDVGIELFGRRRAAPFMIGPTGLNAAPAAD